MIGFHTELEYIDHYDYPLQIFLGSPTSYTHNYNKEKVINNHDVFIHSKYIGNIAKPQSNRALNNITNELNYLNHNNIHNKGTIIHLSKGYHDSRTESLKYVASVLNTYCSNNSDKFINNNHIIIETTGNMNQLGSTTDDLQIVYKNLTNNTKKHVKFCIDTAHVFTTYYNISTITGIFSYLSEFDICIGLKNVTCIHLNDSKGNTLSSYAPHASLTDGNIFNLDCKLNTLVVIKSLSDIYSITCILERGIVRPGNECEMSVKREIKQFNSIIPLDRNIFMAYLNKYKIIYFLLKLLNIYKIINKYKYNVLNSVIPSLRDKLIIFKYDTYNNIAVSHNDIIHEYMKIPNIGKKIANKIYEILTTNNLNELADYTDNAEFKCIQTLTSLKYIGLTKAKELLSKGICTMEKLLLNPQYLTHSQKLSLKYYNKLKPIPRTLISEFDLYLRKNNIKNYKILGSYIRGEEYSNDIDMILISTPIKKFIQIIPVKLVDLFMLGNEKFSGIFNFNNNIIKIDILAVNMDSIYTATLYFTGPKYFNIYIRNIAKQMGYKLNQYGLYDHKDIRMNIKSEKDIFDILHINYLSPTNRNIFTTLTYWNPTRSQCDQSGIMCECNIQY